MPTKLGELCSLITKGTTPTSVGFEFSDSGVKFLRVQNIFDGKVNYADDTLFISADVHKVLKRSQIAPGDVLISIAGTIGRTGIVPDDAPELNCNQAVAILRTTEKVDQSYLRHWLESVEAQRQMRGATVTGTIQNLSLSQIGDLQIPLPPLPEQRRIAAILDQADALRIKRREALAQLDSLAQSIFVEMFGDPLTNPKGWPVVKFGDVGNLDRGISKHRPRNDPALLGGAHPLIQTGDVANSGGYIRAYKSTYSDLGVRQSKLWPRGTLCITIAANIAKTGILTFDACFPDSVVGFSANEEATVEYVRVWLSFLQKTLEENAPESAQKNINLAILRGLDIPLPPIELREHFGQALRVQMNLANSGERSAKQLDAMFASLQHRAFRGEL
ncbi:restriction endonuclease subunit S [Aquabacterium lacunae]|uniref:Restriction endonuclease subunit S n=1 Tax=Aquabacterium lacunae TaxID=2528630 RepID=A0A4Q9GZJ0_9BURK|nr:restriction endonuclease subunit S [Aquabacterium lacunae]TBO31444.1 restriction endonuclease subunit S [Aquabacterium lacunae]